jgi:hypothetical protein
MKKRILTLVFAMATLFAIAQQDHKAEDKKSIAELFQHAKNDFKDITGEKVKEQDGVIYKYCTYNSYLGEMGFITKDTNTGEIIYFFNEVDDSAIKSLSATLKEYIKEKFPEKEYTILTDGADDDEDYWEVTMVYSYISSETMGNRKQFLKYSIETNPQTKTQFFQLIIFGVSAQKVK